jgi:hypothetical protein
MDQGNATAGGPSHLDTGVRGYALSKRSQLVFFIVVFAVAALVVIGYVAAVQAFEQPAADYPEPASWSQAARATGSPAE